MESEINSKSVSDRLANVAEKFLEIAEKTQDTRQAQRALNVVDTALQLSIKLKSHMIDDYAYAFLSHITYKIKRSDLYRSYLAFCTANGFPSYSKSDLFSVCEMSGFIVSKTGGEYFFIPPSKGLPDKGLDLDLVVNPMLPAPRRNYHKAIYDTKKPDSE